MIYVISVIVLLFSSIAMASDEGLLRDLPPGSVLEMEQALEIVPGQDEASFVGGHRAEPVNGSTYCSFETRGRNTAGVRASAHLRFEITRVYEDIDPGSGAYFGTVMDLMQVSGEDLVPSPISRVRCVQSVELEKNLQIYVDGVLQDDNITADGQRPTVQDLVNSLKRWATLRFTNPVN